MTLATLLTLVRLACVPIVAVLLFQKDPLCAVAALGVFGLAVVTDAYDGHLARSRNEVTKFGAFLDPLVDKVLVLTLLGVFASLGFVAWWMYGVITLREVVVTGARMLWFKDDVDTSARALGKHKTAWQMVVLFMLMTVVTLQTVGAHVEGAWKMLADERAIGWLSWLAGLLMWVVLALSVVSGVQFFLAVRESRKRVP